MTTDTISSVWRYSLRLSRALAQYDVEVHLATMGPLPDPKQKKEAFAVSNLHLYESSYKLEWQENPWKEIEQASMWLLFLEQDIQPDLVHLNHYVFGELPWECPVMVVGHTCELSGWEAAEADTTSEKLKQYRVRTTKGLRAANCVVSVSQVTMQRLLKFYGPLNRTEVIYHGISISKSQTKGKEDRYFAVGNLSDKEKNMAALAEVADLLPHPLTVASSENDDMPPKQKNLQLLGKLTQNEVTQWLATSRFFISPSLYDSFGLTTLEAAERGCVLLLSDIESNHEIWQDNALYFDPRDLESLIKLTHELSDSPALVAKMGEKAKTRASEFSIEKMVQNYFQLYQSMLESHRNKQIKTKQINTV